MKLMNRVIRHKCYQLVYERKNNPDYFKDRMEADIEKMNLKDQDFFVDLRLGGQQQIFNLFKAQ